MKHIILIITIIALAFLQGCSDSNADLIDRIQTDRHIAKKHITNGSYAKALWSLLEAETKAIGVNDPLLLGIIHSDMAFLFNYMNSPQYEYKNAKLAYNDFIKTNDTLLIQLSTINLVRAAGNAGEREFNIHHSLADNIIVQQKGNDAISLYLKLEALRSKVREIMMFQKEQTQNYLTLTDEIITELPHDFFKKDSINKPYTYIGLYPGRSGALLNTISFRYATIISEALNKHGMNYGNFAIDTYTHKELNVDEIIDKYILLQKNLEQQKSATKRNRWLFISLTLIAIICLLIFTSVTKDNKMHKERQRIIQEASELQELLQSNAIHITGLKEYINKLYYEKFIILEELCNLFILPNKSRSEQTHIFHSVCNIVSSFKMDGKRLSEIEEYVNRYRENIVADFKHDFPKFKEEDHILFIYIAAGFSRQAIGYFMGETVEVISNRKLRLKQKIRNSSLDGNQRYLNMFN